MLYSYWRSSCSWRVRIALNLKGVDYEYRAVHLVADGGQQLKEEYKAKNAMCQVPSLVLDDGTLLTQSMAILEFLEEKYPADDGCPSLFPGLIRKRAKVYTRIIYIRFNSKLPYLLHRIKNHNNEAANQKLFVETFGHLYEIYEASIDDATNKSAIFWSFCELLSTPFCFEWLEFCVVIRKGGA